MQTTQKSLLIVEDDASLMRALHDKFVNEGFLVFQAMNGEDGLAEALSKKPSCILLDILMPKMDGLTMLRKLREVDKENKVPVILLSNLNEIDNISEALILGIHDYLIKSNWRLEDVVSKVQEKLNPNM